MELEEMFVENEETQSNLFKTQACLPKLRNLRIKQCRKLRIIFSAGICQNLPELTSVEMEDCEELEEIFVGNEETQSNPSKAQPHLPKLQTLTIWNCNMLRMIFSTAICQILPKLTSISIYNCEELEEIFVENEETRSNLSKTHACLPKLQTLTIWHCNKLRIIFSASLCQSLLELTYINISYCEELKEIFVEDEETRSNLSKAQACLPKLQSLRIYDCSKLRIIFSVGICPNLPELTSVHISGCEELEEIFVADEQTQSNLSKAQAHLPKLRWIDINLCNKLRTIFSAGICQNLPELTHVEIRNCDELEKIFVKNNETQSNLSKAQTYLPKLQSLDISQCNKLRFLFSMKINVATSVLPQLSHLNISKAAQMEEIFKSANTEDDVTDNKKEITFRNLKYIGLENLPRLVDVSHGFKLHVADFCSIVLYECPKFVPIMGARIDWEPQGLVRKFLLKCSQLSNNEALTIPFSILNSGEPNIQSSRVCDLLRVMGDDDEPQASNDTKMLGSEYQRVKGLFPTQVLSFQYLHTLEVIRCEKLKFLFSMSTILPKLTILTLSNCDELEEIIANNGKPQNILDAQICFPKLRVLEVKGCNKLKRLFSTNVATMLPQLQSLCIIEAAQLEEIFEHKGKSKEEEQYFPELAKLIVHRCNNLKCLFFSLPSNGDLAQLKYLEIILCSQLEHVFGCEPEIHDGGLNKNVLPKLKQLKLEELPNLTDICADFPFQLQFPSLLSYVVEDCPTFSKITLAAIDNFLPRHQGSPDDYQESEDTYDFDSSMKKYHGYNTSLGFLCMTSGCLKDACSST